MYTAEQCYELALLTICVWREARGEARIAKDGVAWVIKNRVAKGGWFGKRYVDVILKPMQFSSFNANDPNATKLPNPTTDPSFGECLLAAKYAYEGTSADPTLGATYYHDTSIKPPFWAPTMVLTVQLGKLIFYREK